ncbi:hypothetical protein H310_07195 [Aphanomyces invadans]|uniref:Asparagine synthetase domain-containing protein n=1 Tax=Aphanomyces invadans TaxID=157072 RepID=A0A024U2Z5_9STRA|nr:hypothetical protein H310_07195 [Aphanomyces invadans]ETW00624.1 hypothetical protein H310_07195 [Aphanomyces invadans]|eukprot:XP_008870759.1 hypothetical protein H310_07195 [Aphanomyces invadans]
MTLFMVSAVLHLRGTSMCKQPVRDSHGNVLLWNGEVFGGACIPIFESDTVHLSQRLASIDDHDMETTAAKVVQAISSIQGPFAFAWLHVSTNTLFYGRDRWGRRSLVMHMPLQADATMLFQLASVALDSLEDWEEVGCTGIYSLNLSTVCAKPQLHLWPPPAISLSIPCRPPLPPSIEALVRFDCDPHSTSSAMLQSAKHLLQVLSASVAKRVESIPPAATVGGHELSPARVGVLFSGGLDSVVLAALTHFHLPREDPVDLLSICFDKDHSSPDRKAAISSWMELIHLFPTRTWRFIAIDVPRDQVDVHQPHILQLMQPCKTHMDFNIGTAFWFLARGHGTILDVKSPADENVAPSGLPRAPVVILFEASTDGRCPVATCPGRKPHSGCNLQSHMCKACCTRSYKLAAKVISYATHPQEVASCFAALDSMGIPREKLLLWLDTLRRDDVPSTCRKLSSLMPSAAATDSIKLGHPYTSQAKVLLVGIGADEQVAGYSRHKEAFVTKGWDGLRAELDMDMSRIWQRNLGRDDRMIADHGREARFPYLDEDVIALLRSIPLDHVVDFAQPRGVGDKLILRIVARQLGLIHCTGLAKQAIQFGTRIAKQSNDRVLGHKPKGTTMFLAA